MKPLFYCFFFLFALTSSFSQQYNLSNSEYLILQEKARTLINSNIDSSFILASKIEKSNNPLHKSFANGIKSYLFQLKLDTIQSNKCNKEAFTFFNKALPSLEKTKTLSYLLNYEGLINWKRNHFNLAITKFSEGKKVSEKLNDLMQIVKFNNNIGLIYNEIGNYKLAIKITKQSELIANKIQNEYSKEQFIINKCNTYLRLGTYYESNYKNAEHNKQLLDSALYFYKKAISYSKYSEGNRTKSQINIGNIYYIKKNYPQAEAMYLNALQFAKEKNQQEDYYKIIYNLGDLYYFKNDIKKSLACFYKVDSIYNTNKTNINEFINSNFYQAKIYSFQNDSINAAKHAKIYLENYEKKETQLNNNTLEINSQISDEEIKNEMLTIQERNYKNVNWNRILIGILIVTLFSVVVMLIRNNKKKKIAEEKTINLIEKYKNFDVNESIAIVELPNKNNKEILKNNAVINNEKEAEILKNLKLLEEKKYYLHPEFTQQTVAKKIKTNTSYLSIIVNKYYNKSFSEYSNELRINYAINEMMKNATYRRYSTQAIAESVGFKNAVSFTKSFNKRTGLTPAQFIKGLDKIS